MSHRQWRKHFGEMARDYWTEERERELLQGKDLLLTPTGSPHVLRAIGLLHRDASMPPRQRRKFFQLNHMLRLLEAPLSDISDPGHTLRIVDAGCGLGYVTIALAWVLEKVRNQPAEVIGIDRRQSLVAECNDAADLIGVADTVRFLAGDVADFDPGHSFGGDGAVDVVIGLHACDTATDDAIVLGDQYSARVIAVAPCCQAELAAKWAQEFSPQGPFASVWRTPHLRRELAATLTDTFRQLLLGAAGYEAKAIEFVAAEHTPKNTLIRARKVGEPDPDAMVSYRELVASTGGKEIGLASRLRFGRLSETRGG